MKPVLRYAGSKWNIVRWIVEHMPPHKTYLEPFFGSGAVFFCKKPSHLETINDINGDVINLFRVIRDQPEELIRLVEFTPWARAEYYESYGRTGEPVEDARRFLVRCWQAYGAKLSDRAGWSNEIQGNVGKSLSLRWKGLPERIEAAVQRLKDAQIEHQDALKLIKAYRYAGVLIYADPPYPRGTRVKRQYANEMKDADHIELLELLDQHPGPVMLSGYACPMYDEKLKHWARKEARAFAQNGKRRTEVLWLNLIAAAELTRAELFRG